MDRQLNEMESEFLKAQCDLLKFSVELFTNGKYDKQFLSSRINKELKNLVAVWTKIENGNYEKIECGYSDIFWTGQIPSMQITESNYKFLVEKAKNWNLLEPLLRKNELLPLLNPHHTPAEDAEMIFKHNLDGITDSQPFFDILIGSGNISLADFLNTAKEDFKASDLFAKLEENYKENEEDLSKLDGKDEIIRKSPHFMDYINLREFCKIYTLKMRVKALTRTILDLEPLSKESEMNLKKIKRPDILKPDNNENIDTIEEIHTQSTFFKCCGTPKRSEIFSPSIGQGSSLNHKILTWIHLEYLDIYTPLLFQTLEDCPNLRILRILDVRFIGVLNRRVTLPNIQTFALSTRLPNLDKGEGRNVDKSMFKSLIFFQREIEKSSWSVETISQLKIDIDISLNGERIFKIRHKDGLLFSQLNYTNEILSNIVKQNDDEFKLKQLFLRFCEIDVSSVPTKDLTLIEVKDVTYTRGGSLCAILNKCLVLEILRVGYTQSTIFNLLQLSQTSTYATLKYLYLYNVHIPYLPVVVRLDTLFLYCCSLAPEAVDKFSRIFKARRILIICKTMEHCNFCSFCSHIRILNEARKSECAKWISMKKFDRGHRNNHTDKRDYLVEQGLESFLKKSGITEGSTHFILEKKEGMEEWVGKDVIVDDQGWKEQQSVIQKFEVEEDDATFPHFNYEL